MGRVVLHQQRFFYIFQNFPGRCCHLLSATFIYRYRLLAVSIQSFPWLTRTGICLPPSKLLFDYLQMPKMDLPMEMDITPDLFTSYVKMKFPEMGSATAKTPPHRCGFYFKAKVCVTSDSITDVIEALKATSRIAMLVFQFVAVPVPVNTVCFYHAIWRR